MAIVNGARHVTAFKAAKLRYRTLSGTVKKSGSGVARRVIVYKVGVPELLVGDTVSASGTGIFSVEVPVGSNNKLRLICLGESGENSEIFEDVSAG